MSLGDMTIHAGSIPCSKRVVFLQFRWNQKRLRHRRPHFFCDDVSNGKLLQGTALARFQPQDLQVVRAGHEDDLLWLAVVTVTGSHNLQILWLESGQGRTLQ